MLMGLSLLRDGQMSTAFLQGVRPPTSSALPSCSSFPAGVYLLGTGVGMGFQEIRPFITPNERIKVDT